MKRLKILGADCLCVGSAIEIKKYVFDLIENRIGGYSVAINAEKIMMYNRNADMRELIDKSVLPTPDGAGAVLGMKCLYNEKCIKIDFPKMVFELANENKCKMFILGSTEDVNRKSVEIIKLKYPDIVITGRKNGYFENDDDVTGIIENAAPQVVMTALGSPRQEKMSRNLADKIPGVLFIGCGGALDALTGKVKRAPAFFVNNNLEWFYRLIQSPSRIKRQRILPLFFVKLLYTAYLKKKFNV